MISSPRATGGAGTFFEQHVAAYWLAQLLVGSIPPILTDCTVTGVHLQTEHLGCKTDDFMVEAENSTGQTPKLIGQVKSTFTVSKKDEDCKKAILDFWHDFNSQTVFRPDIDKFVLVVKQGTNTLLSNFGTLLDYARISLNQADFRGRIDTPGLLNRKSHDHLEALRQIIGEGEKRNVQPEELWEFLKHLYILSLDLNTSTKQTETNIKSLLAFTANAPDAVSKADQTWNKLLALAGEGNPQGASYQFDSLPSDIIERHSKIGPDEHAAIQALKEHSAIIIDDIHTNLHNGYELDRAGLIQDVLNKMVTCRIVLITGNAGSGKSGIAKKLLNRLSENYFTFCFRAEEFAHSHFDETLHKAQIPTNTTGVQALLAGQDRKVLLIESVERLLEHSTRDAFTSLITSFANDPSWQLIITCREYSLDGVRDGLLGFAQTPFIKITIPELGEEELNKIQLQCPDLSIPLSNPALRKLLSNLYFLNIATKITWHSNTPLPQSEYDFREMFWRKIIRDESYTAGGMPNRRERAFHDIILLRAKELKPYIRLENPDDGAIEALSRDSLISQHPQVPSLFAPAHDVLEDWGIIRWINGRYFEHEKQAVPFSQELGCYPAVRRTYRKWVSELVHRIPEDAGKLFCEIISQTEIPAYFNDDTIVSILRSDCSTDFLNSQAELLFADDKKLLKKVIHLLRTACVTTSWMWYLQIGGSSSTIPNGRAWACVLDIVQSHLDTFTRDDRLLLLGLIEDWAKGITITEPYPDGAKAANAMVYWLLENFNSYSHPEMQKRILKVLLKIPGIDETSFEKLLFAMNKSGQSVRIAEILSDLIFNVSGGAFMARDMPETLATATKNYLLYTESDNLTDYRFMHPFDLEIIFGIRLERNFGHMPPSALRGPLFHLLRSHQDIGVGLLLEVMNHCADWYAHPRVKHDIERPYKVELSFPDGTKTTQWASLRLWGFYRGTSQGPDILQSLLMAFEKWLLEWAEENQDDLDDFMLSILQRSDSVAITAVICSVATAYAHSSINTLIILLNTPDCIFFDMQRCVKENYAPSKVYDARLSKKDIYVWERKEADNLPHRKLHLENAILTAQFGPHATKIQEVLDKYPSRFPSLKLSEEDEQLLRLSLHRMDLRRYSPTCTLEEIPDKAGNDKNQQKTLLRLDPKTPDDDLQEMIDENTEKYKGLLENHGVCIWAHNVFMRQDPQKFNPADWEEYLELAKRQYQNG